MLMREEALFADAGSSGSPRFVVGSDIILAACAHAELSWSAKWVREQADHLQLLDFPATAQSALECQSFLHIPSIATRVLLQETPVAVESLSSQGAIEEFSAVQRERQSFVRAKPRSERGVIGCGTWRMGRSQRAARVMCRPTEKMTPQHAQA